MRPVAKVLGLFDIRLQNLPASAIIEYHVMRRLVDAALNRKVGTLHQIELVSVSCLFTTHTLHQEDPGEGHQVSREWDRDVPGRTSSASRVVEVRLGDRSSLSPYRRLNTLANCREIASDTIKSRVK